VWQINFTNLKRERNNEEIKEDVDSGLQIGIVNIVHNNKSWFEDLPNSLAPVMILVNW